ncbi:MAG: integron integrase, partial [Nitrospirota bacterium]
RTGERRRHHLHETVPPRAIRDVKTTMIYTHVLNRGGRGVKSPADRLPE